MRILVLGADGYLGWPTAMHFSSRGHEVAVLDNFVKRKWEMEQDISPLVPVASLQTRIRAWEELTGKKIQNYVCDLLNARQTYKCLEEFRPEAIIHYAEQPSAPYSMMMRSCAVETQSNNVIGTLNLLFAMNRFCPEAHLIKLGTMGEYGTPNIDIEEGFIEVEHKGRKDVLPFPKQPFSFYHLSKVHDSNNIMFACRVWGLRSTDLNQGVVYGISTEETVRDPRLTTSFHYDSIFGTVLNRFCVQAVAGIPLTLYGSGGQIRSFLNIRDTLQCVELVALNPPAEGQFRVYNQFTEVFSLVELANLVQEAAAKVGIEVTIQNVDNPRIESENHYYNPVSQNLRSLGLKPRLLSDVLVQDMLRYIVAHKDYINPIHIPPTIRWRQKDKSQASDA